MTLKIGSWMIAVGCFLAFAGLSFFPAALTKPHDMAVLSAGAMLFSTGMVLSALGLYMKARFWSEAEPSQPRVGTKGKRKTCNQCGSQESAVECRVHHLHLCADCLGKHYDFKSCAYVPSVKQTARAKSHASGA
ncbi:MAG TPA: hypothetical protein VMI10_06855 [Terriglobales bacterium]|nr:hypothetical protein [Terriglobales bacterium]